MSKKTTNALESIKNSDLAQWVEEMIALCKPETVHWCDGSQKEYDSLCEAMVEGGTFIRLNPEKRPNCFLARSHPSDVARVEDRTYICSLSKGDAGPTNNWMAPREMRTILTGKLDGSSRGTTARFTPSIQRQASSAWLRGPMTKRILMRWHPSVKMPSLPMWRSPERWEMQLE